MTRTPSREELIQDLYRAFDAYAAEGVFGCGYCYSQEEVAYYRREPVHLITPEAARIALWETGDHWSSSQAYRHFLPRMLEVMGPPYNVEDMYVGHLFETLLFHGFLDWPQGERAAVLAYLAWLQEEIDLSQEGDEEEWHKGMADLAGYRSPEERRQ